MNEENDKTTEELETNPQAITTPDDTALLDAGEPTEAFPAAQDDALSAAPGVTMEPLVTAKNSGAVSVATRQRKQMLLVSGIALALIIVVVALTSGMFASPKTAISKAFAATIVEQNKRMERIRAEIPMMQPAKTPAVAAKTDFDFSYRSLDGNLQPDILMIGKLLAGLGVRGSVVSDPASPTMELDVAVAMGATRLLGGYFYVSPDLMAAGSPDFSDTMLTLNPQTFAADARASALYRALGMDEEQLARMQDSINKNMELLTNGQGTTTESAEMKAFRDKVGAIFAKTTDNAKYAKLGKEDGNRLYRVSIPGAAVKTALIELMDYIYFTSPLADLYREAFSQELPYGMSYDQVIDDMITSLQENCPDLPLQLDLAVNKSIQTASLTILPANVGSIAAPFDKFMLLFGQRDDDVSYQVAYSANLGGIPAKLTAGFDQSYTDGTYGQNFQIGMDADEYLNAKFNVNVSMDRDDSCEADVVVDYKDGDEWARFRIGANGTIKTTGDAKSYNFPSINLSAEGTNIGNVFDEGQYGGEVRALFAFKADVAPITAPYLMKKPSKAFFGMDQAAFEEERMKYEDGIKRLVTNLSKMMFGI